MRSAVVVLAVALGHAALADPPARYTFRSYGSEHGLGNLAINQIEQGSDGLLWVATEDGLYSYDGERFRRTDLDRATHSNWIFSLLPTTRGLWIGTAKGLALLDRDRETVTVPPGLPADRVNALAQAPDGSMWAATEIGLFHEVGGAFVAAPGWPGGGSWALAIGRDGKVIAGRGPDVAIQVDGEHWRVLGEAAGFGRDRIDAFARLPDGSVWVRSALFLWACDPQLAACHDSTGVLPDVSEIGRLLVDRAGTLWVTTRRGVAHRLADGRWTVLDGDRGLPVRSVISAFEDRDGSLWLAGDQLYRLLGHGQWTAYAADAGFPADTVWTMLRDARGTLWVGSNRGLLEATGDHWSVLPGTEPYTIETVVEAGPVLYASGTAARVMRIDRATRTAEIIGPPPGLRGDEINSLVYDRGTLWMGSLNGGLLRMVEDHGALTWQREPVPGGDTREDFNQLILDRRGRLWAAGSSGLAMRDGGRWYRYTTRDGLAAPGVEYVMERASGELCVAYTEALGVTCFRADGPQLTGVHQLTRATGLTSDTVYLLGEDHAGRLYVGQGVGVDIIDGDSISHVAEDSGLVGDDCAARAFWADPGGDVMIGSTRGLSRYAAGDPIAPPPPPVPLIMGLSLGGAPARLAGEVTAPGTGTSSLTVQFATPWFGNRARLERQTRLLPIETEWRATTAEEAQFLALGHGEYVFEVRARLASGPYGEVARVAFTIRPSWWQMPWFRAALALAALALIALVIRWRVRVMSARASQRITARSEASFRTLIEQSPDAMFVHRHGMLLYANAQTLVLLGYAEPGELIGTPLLDRVHPDEHAGVLARTEALIDSGTPRRAREVRMLRQDGTPVITETAALRVEFEGAPAILVIARDCTERKELESRLMFADRMASIGTMAAGIAHEVNNPLAYLKANLALITEELAPDASPLLRVAVADALEGANRVEHIVKGVKAFSRAEGEQRTPIDIEKALELALRMTANELRHRCRIVKDYGPVPAVLGSESRLGQVFMNLLANAAQAMAGSPMASNELHIATRTDAEGHAVIEVRDTGCGMAPEVSRRVFEPFFTTKDVGEGTGLGLAICHGIVESLGGTITVDSVPGAGSTFRIVLPGTTRTQAPAIAAATTSVTRSRTVLVIDDDERLLASIGRMLRKEHEVVLATSAAAALERLRAGERFDIIVCDLMMPGFTGMALHAELEARFPAQAGRMLFMTGGAFTSEARDFVDRPAIRCLEKPFEAAELRRQLQTFAAAEDTCAPPPPPAPEVPEAPGTHGPAVRS